MKGVFPELLLLKHFPLPSRLQNFENGFLRFKN